MKHLKMLGLAAAAAMALTALVGTGTAAATVICKNNADTTNCSEPYEKGATGKASLKSGTSARLTSGGSTIATCTESVVESSLEVPGSSTSTVKSALSTITWGGCNQTTHTINPGYGELHWISGTDNGQLTTFNTEVTQNIFGVSCTYGAAAGGTNVGTTVGGNPGFLKVETTFVKKAGGFLCPGTVGFDGEYVATEPTAAWVSQG